MEYLYLRKLSKIHDHVDFYHPYEFHINLQVKYYIENLNFLTKYNNSKFVNL